MVDTGGSLPLTRPDRFDFFHVPVAVRQRLLVLGAVFIFDHHAGLVVDGISLRVWRRAAADRVVHERKVALVAERAGPLRDKQFADLAASLDDGLGAGLIQFRQRSLARLTIVADAQGLLLALIQRGRIV